MRFDDFSASTKQQINIGTVATNQPRTHKQCRAAHNKDIMLSDLFWLPKKTKDDGCVPVDIRE